MRHCQWKRLKNPDQARKLAPSIWELPPYIIAEFGGNLAMVMLEAARQYIYEGCLAQASHNFEMTAFHNKKSS